MNMKSIVCASVLSIAVAGLAGWPASAAPKPVSNDKFRMPKLVGMVLQDAQDLLQSRGSYLLDQEDARGLGRWQLLDSGWRVCAQKPRPGTQVSADTLVTLWSVKLSGRCP